MSLFSFVFVVEVFCWLFARVKEGGLFSGFKWKVVVVWELKFPILCVQIIFFFSVKLRSKYCVRDGFFFDMRPFWA